MSGDAAVCYSYLLFADDQWMDGWMGVGNMVLGSNNWIEWLIRYEWLVGLMNKRSKQQQQHPTTTTALATNDAITLNQKAISMAQAGDVCIRNFDS